MNRFEGIHPTWSGWDLTLTLEEKMHLQSLANSRSMLDRYLCLRYLDQNFEEEQNSRFVLKMCDQLIPDKTEKVSGQAMMLLEQYLGQKGSLVDFLNDKSEISSPLSPKEIQDRLEEYKDWDPAEQAWPLVKKFCSSRNRELRRYAAVLLLEHLFWDRFDDFFPQAARLVKNGDKRMLDAMNCIYFDLKSIGTEGMNRADSLMRQHLKGKDLKRWDRYHRIEMGIDKPSHSEPKKFRSLHGKNRLIDRELIETLDVSRLNQEERDYVTSLAMSRRKKDRIRSLEIFDHWRRVKNHRSLFFSTVDHLLGDRNIEVRSFAAFTLAELGEINPKRMFDLIVKHGSSPSPHTQRMIAIGPLGLFDGFFDHDQRNRFEMLFEALEKGNKNFARTVSQMLLWGMGSENSERLEQLLSEHLEKEELNAWRKRSRWFRSGIETA